MAKTSINCPSCRAPITAEITRLFDMNTNPQAKEQLLSGSANSISCPVCHYQGVYPTPIVYHDADKELLLTYFPPELNAPVNEQERMIGPLIKKTVDDLPPAKRKAYLFQPQTMLTQQRLFETILEADGITPQMMKSQQDKLALIQRLAMAKPDVLPELISQEDAKIDEEVLILISRLAQASASEGDDQGAQLLVGLQKALIDHSTYGKSVAEQAEETQAAMRDLQELSKKGLTRESLLELIISSASSEVRLTAIVSMVRTGLDYEFFQLLTNKIEVAGDEEEVRLTEIREQLLAITAEIDSIMKEQTAQAKILLDELLNAEDIQVATQEALPLITQAFTDLINSEASAAQAAQDDGKLKKLAIIVSVLRAASSSGAYADIIEALLQAPDKAARQQILESSGEAINAEFLQMFGGLINMLQEKQESPEVMAKLQEINREIIRFTMTQTMKKEN